MTSEYEKGNAHRLQEGTASAELSDSDLEAVTGGIGGISGPLAEMLLHAAGQMRADPAETRQQARDAANAALQSEANSPEAQAALQLQSAVVAGVAGLNGGLKST